MSIERPDRSLKLLYGDELYNRILKSKVLIGGSGGVGCEIIKSLSKTGFRNFTLIDLDTIELTNLNRQFYFRKHHVGKAKSECARLGVMEVEPEILNVEAVLGNIYDERFNDSYYRQFNLAFCAFDNQGARRYFGQMCSQNNIPMVEAGTSGYSGDVSTKIKGQFECRNCKPETKQVTFNVCSIRTRPSEPIHCIVWASNMFNLIFGPSDDTNMLDNYIADIFPGGAKKVTNPKQCALDLFDKIFNEDIQKCDEKVRFPLSLEDALKINNTNEAIYVDPRTGRTLLEDEKILTVSQYATKFLTSFEEIFIQRQSTLGEMKFDKDDLLAIKFVSAIANLRTYNFRNLEDPKTKLIFLSEHKIKEMAGNIIPAIASTNAIVSAIQINEAIKIMKGFHLTKPNLFSEYLIHNDSVQKINPTVQNTPNLSCCACSPANCYVRIKGNIENLTFGDAKQYFEDKYQAFNQVYEFQKKTVYDPNMSFLREASAKLFLRKLNDLAPQANELHFRLSSLSSQINWRFSLTHDPKIEGKVILCEVDSTPDKIRQQQITFLKLKHKEQQAQKFDLFQRLNYLQ